MISWVVLCVGRALNGWPGAFELVCAGVRASVFSIKSNQF